MCRLGERDDRERRRPRPPSRSRSPVSTRVRQARGTTAAATIADERRDEHRAAASHSLGVTEAPQRRGVARSELGEDPLVEDARDEGDQQQVDRDADLDRERGGPGSERAASARPFSTSTMPSTWNSVARRVAAVTRPRATSDSVACSAAGRVEAEGRNQPDQRQCERDRGGGARERRDAGPDRPRLPRAADEEEEQRRPAPRRGVRVRPPRRRRRATCPRRRLLPRAASAWAVTRPTAIERRRTTTTPIPSATRVQAIPLMRASTSQVTMPSSATAAPTPISRGTSRMRIFAISGLGDGEREAEQREREREAERVATRCPRVGKEDLRCENEHEPVPGGERPLEERLVAAGELEHRALRGSSSARGGCRGCRRAAVPVSATTTSANATAPSASAGVVHGCPPAVPAMTPRRSVVPATSAATARERTSAASTNTESVRSRLAP